MRKATPRKPEYQGGSHTNEAIWPATCKWLTTARRIVGHIYRGLSKAGHYHRGSQSWVHGRVSLLKVSQASQDSSSLLCWYSTPSYDGTSHTGMGLFSFRSPSLKLVKDPMSKCLFSVKYWKTEVTVHVETQTRSAISRCVVVAIYDRNRVLT